MVSGETFTAIDIGSSKIKTIIWVFNEEKKLRVLWVGVSSSLGVRKGNILDMDEFKNNIDASLSEAERMTWEQVSHVYLSLSGTGIDVATNKWIVAVMDSEITEEDINRSLDMAQNWVDLQNRVVLKVIPEQFSCDFESGIKNPIWMTAKKLEVIAHIFSIGSNVLNNIKKWIFDVGVDIVDVYPNLITSGEAVLTKRQKELWVVCIDIWASTTGVTVYEEWALIYSGVIPIGWENVTSDVALGARVSIDLAEKLKIEYGDLGLCKIEKWKDEEIELEKLSKNETGTLSMKYLSEITRARYAELFYYVNSELKKIWKDWMLPEWAIITGGWAKMKWILELSKEVLRLPSAIWVPEDSDFISGTSISDPQFSSVIWTLLLSQKYSTHKWSKLNFSIGWYWNSLKSLFYKIVPKG
ncbi:MAG: cell division protein FtsA [uncultured bacterium (gcode 4)]|uniref:Cell division protein FtsA n=1 Tax=uncultured bacterium (gcode 4) TaxID=1234023 RepID=K2AY59_9BACT|nr:MAG: cell division protein FtsA [uncultured bacterium (gcode 4)]